MIFDPLKDRPSLFYCSNCKAYMGHGPQTLCQSCAQQHAEAHIIMKRLARLADERMQPPVIQKPTRFQELVGFLLSRMRISR